MEGIGQMDSGLPLVSVVTLTYRHFDTLYKTIASVLEQEYPNIQYIICDDGSDNFPRSEIESFIRDRNISFDIVIEHNEKNQGTVKNINHAYKLAKGKYIMNLSAGDIFFEKETVGKVVKEFERRKCDVLVTSRILYKGDLEPDSLLPHYRDRKRIAKWDTPDKQRRAFVTSFFYDMASGSAMYFTNDVMKKYNYFDEKYVLWEDGPFINRYMMDHKIECAYDIVSIWYEDGGVSNSGNIHPLLYADLIKFNHGDKLVGTEKYSRFDKMKIAYRNACVESKGRKQWLCIKIRYFPVFICNIFRFLGNKRNIRVDRSIIEKILNQDRSHNG